MDANLKKYGFNIVWSAEDLGYICRCPQVKNLLTFGDTHEESLAEGLIALGMYIEADNEDKDNG